MRIVIYIGSLVILFIGSYLAPSFTECGFMMTGYVGGFGLAYAIRPKTNNHD